MCVETRTVVWETRTREVSCRLVKTMTVREGSAHERSDHAKISEPKKERAKLSVACNLGLSACAQPIVMEQNLPSAGEVYLLTTSVPSSTQAAGKVYKFVDPRV